MARNSSHTFSLWADFSPGFSMPLERSMAKMTALLTRIANSTSFMYSAKPVVLLLHSHSSVQRDSVWVRVLALYLADSIQSLAPLLPSPIPENSCVPEHRARIAWALCAFITIMRSFLHFSLFHIFQRQSLFSLPVSASFLWLFWDNAHYICMWVEF